MAVLSVRVPSLQQSSFTGHGLHRADKVPRCKQDFIRVNLGFCAPASDNRRLWAGDSLKRWNGSKVRDAFLLGSQRPFRDSPTQRCGSKFANVLSEGSGDGGGGNAGNGSGGGGSERPSHGENAGGDDNASNFDLEAALLCCAVALGLWTSRNKECRALPRVAGKVPGRDSQHDGSTENSSGDQVDNQGAVPLVVEHLQGVVQSAALLLSSLNNGSLFSGTSASDPSTSGRGSEEATFSFSTLASLSMPFLSFMSKKGASAREETPPKVDEVWEVQGDSWTRLVPGGPEENEWILSGHFRGRPAEKLDEESASASTSGEGEAPRKGRSFEKGARRAMDRIAAQLRSTLLPEGFPHSVTEDYPEYSAWRVGQIVASQVNGVLCTQALLYAVGLGKGAIPTAAAVNWVLKDGIGYLSKIAFSKYGRHFDVHPKGWRLFCDAVEDLSYGLELLTPAFPNQFLYFGAAASAFRSGAGMGQAATRNSYYASFSKQGNLAELVAKAEAQGMFAKSIGIPLGILVAGKVGHTGPVLAVSYAAVTLAHLFCNLRSYQAVQLRTLNPDRATLVLAEFVRTGRVPSIKAVNAEDPLFPVGSKLNLRAPLKKLSESLGQVASPEELSPQAKDLALGLAGRIELGAEVRSVCTKPQELESLRRLYRSEKYMLAQTGETLKVVLKKGARQQDMLRALTQAIYLESEGQKSRPLETSYRNMTRSFDKLQKEVTKAGYIGELVVRPGAARLVA